MKRRAFTQRALALLGGASLASVGRLQNSHASTGAAPGVPPFQSADLPYPTGRSQELHAVQELRVNGSRLNGTLETLTGFGRTTDGGIDRVAFSEADRLARDFMAQHLEQSGFTVEVDAAANLIGNKPGSEDLLPIMMGSHVDSVPNGGNYDGQVGSMGALEVARTLSDAGVVTRHPLQVVLFTNEEAGKTGSRAMAAEVEPFELDLETASGLTIGEGIRANGGDPTHLEDAALAQESLAAFLELHVEQGGILDREGIQIGVVEGIVGIRRWTITVDGFANHAGTTPMPDRRDAMVAAARLIQAVNRIALETPGRQVATVGRIQAEPGAPNVVPGRVVASLEIRDLSMAKIEMVYEEIAAEAQRIAAESETEIRLEQFYVSRAAPTDERLRDRIEQSAAGLDLTSVRMPSGAGHDAQSIALVAPIGMIFVPSVDGISHSPREYSRPEDIEAGANVLLRTLLSIDRDWP